MIIEFDFFASARHTETGHDLAVFRSENSAVAEFLIGDASYIIRGMKSPDLRPAAVTIADGAEAVKGTYRHYKGQRYEVAGIAKDAVSGEEFILYKPLYECEFAFFLRPRAMFLGSLNETTPRFLKEAA